MPIKIGPNHQITIPKEIFESLHLKVEDFVKTTIKDNTVALIPQKLVPGAQEWLWTKEWQKREKEVVRPLEKDEMSGLFSKATDALKWLLLATEDSLIIS